MDEQYPAAQYNKEERVVSFSKEAADLKVLKLQTSIEGLRGGWQLSISPDQSEVSNGYV